MGQQRATARYSSCLIARAISEMTPKPSQLISYLQEFNFFQNPDILIHKPLPDTLQTHIKKLIREGFDPATFWQYELRTLSQHFQEGLHVLRTLFKVKRSQKQTPSLTSFFVSEHEWWGTNYFHESNIMNIHPPFLFLPAVSKSLVLRDAIRIFLPTSFQNALDVQEFANVLVTDLVNPSERQVWDQIKWNGTQPTPEQQDWISTIIAVTPKLIEKSRLPALYTRLKRIESLVERVPTGSFTIIAQQELTEIIPHLTITDPQQKILFTLVRDPLVSERQIATATKLARGTVNRNLLALQEQFGITFPGEINYQKIGLTPLLLTASSLTSPTTGSTKLFELSQHLRTFPYCFRLHAPQAPASTTLYAILALPERTIPEFLRLLNKWKKDAQVLTQLLRIGQYEWGWDFAYWTEFLPVEWKILASSSLRPEGSESNFTNFIRYEEPSIKLTREALRVLLILQNDMRISQRQLAKDAQTSVTTAANHYNRLIPDIITPYTGFTHPPLPESSLITVDASSVESAKELLAGIRLLPGFQIWHLTQSPTQVPSSFLITVNFPEGGLVPFLAAFEEVSSFYEIIPRLPQIISRQLPQVHELPLALFKTVGQEWMCSSPLLESLFRPQ
jgi:DNA-binding MarR family transcriptional regulator